MATTGILGSFNEWLKKPENQLLLAGAGQKLDPTGVGGALGGATGAYLQSNIAAERADKQEAQRNQQAKMVSDVLARMADPNSGNLITPKGTQGVTGVKANNDGSLRIDADVSPTSQQMQTTPVTQQLKTSTNAVGTPSPAVSPAGAELLNQGTSENPLALEGTTVTAQREPVPVAAQPPANTTRPFDIRSIIPFS